MIQRVKSLLWLLKSERSYPPWMEQTKRYAYHFLEHIDSMLNIAIHKGYITSGQLMPTVFLLYNNELIPSHEQTAFSHKV